MRPGIQNSRQLANWEPALTISTPERDFAEYVVKKLHDAGFVALFNGGCVRDLLLSRVPKDYDVATSASTDEVRRVFGRRLTVPVGESFGVVMVVPNRSEWPKEAGTVEVATFRSDSGYSDGRRPDSVAFATPEKDAQRRDFTINGMFYDPIADRLHDFVGGQEDLKAGIVRAIGNPRQRMSEDKLRVLRAIRFTATFGFELEPQTAAAVSEMAALLSVVSVERITQEVRRMFAHSSRASALRLMLDSRVFSVVFPELDATIASETTLANAVCHDFEHLDSDCFEPALAILLQSLLRPERDDPAGRVAEVTKACRRQRFSNSETDRIAWLVAGFDRLCTSQTLPLHVTKPLLAHEDAPLLLAMLTAIGERREPAREAAARLIDYRSQTPAAVLDPPPLLDGGDLFRLGIPPGATFGLVLREVRRQQLDELISTKSEAEETARRVGGRE